MRPACARLQRERGLRIAVAVDLDAGGCAAERAPPVGADDEPRGDAAAAFERDGDGGILGLDRDGVVLDRVQHRQARCARVSSAATRCRFSILWPKASSPISLASNRPPARATAARVSSTIRIREAARPAPRSRPRPRASRAR